MTADAGWFRRTADLVHAQAVQSRERDGMCAETVLCFDDRGELYVTILGTGPGISADAARHYRPRRTLVLESGARDAGAEVARLVRQALPRGRTCVGVIYTRPEPDRAGKEVRTVAVSSLLGVLRVAATALPGGSVSIDDPDDDTATWLRSILELGEPRPEPMSGR
jgi:hypothetical protein